MPEINSTSAAIANRLNRALEYRGASSQSEKIQRVMEATGCTRRTASRWLAGIGKPAAGVLDLSTALHIDPRWLWDGNGIDPKCIDLVHAIMLLPEPERGLRARQYTRMALRLLNKDAKVLRLLGMRDRGEISQAQLLAMM